MCLLLLAPSVCPLHVHSTHFTRSSGPGDLGSNSCIEGALLEILYASSSDAARDSASCFFGHHVCVKTRGRGCCGRELMGARFSVCRRVVRPPRRSRGPSMSSSLSAGGWLRRRCTHLVTICHSSMRLIYVWIEKNTLDYSHMILIMLTAHTCGSVSAPGSTPG